MKTFIQYLYEVRGNRSSKDKRMAKKRRRAINKKNCGKGKTPSVTKSGNSYRVKCTKKDKKKSRKMKKVARKVNRGSSGRKKSKRASKTKSFRR